MSLRSYELVGEAADRLAAVRVWRLSDWDANRDDDKEDEAELIALQRR